MDLTDITVGEVISIGATVATASVAWIKRYSWILPIGKKIVSKISNYLPSCRQRKLLDEIIKELKPNGGSSMRDKIDSTSKTVNEIKATIKNDQKQFLFLKKRSETRDEMAHVANFETDANGECTFANKSYCNLVGLKLEELLGNGWANVISDKEREYVFREWSDAVKYKRDFHLRFHYKNTSTDETFPVKVDAFVIKDDHGEVLGWLGYTIRVRDLEETQRIK